MAILRNMAAMLSTTTGTGTLTLTTAFSGGITFDNAGVPHGGVTVTYLIIDGTNREIGRGVYTFSGLTLTRATVIASTNGNAKISCSGSQTVTIVDSYLDHIATDEAQATAFTAAQQAQILTNIGGATWGGQLVKPVLANFTQFGTGGVFTQNLNANSVSITRATTNATQSLVGMSVAAPATPYRSQALIKPQHVWDGSNSANRSHVGFYDGTKLQTIALDSFGTVGNTEFDVFNNNSVTSYNSVVASANTKIGRMPDTVWLGVADDGTNVYFEYSYDGINWVQILSTTKTGANGFLGASGYTNLCVMVDTYYNSTTLKGGLVLFSWNTVASAP